MKNTNIINVVVVEDGFLMMNYSFNNMDEAKYAFVKICEYLFEIRGSELIKAIEDGFYTGRNDNDEHVEVSISEPEIFVEDIWVK